MEECHHQMRHILARRHHNAQDSLVKRIHKWDSNHLHNKGMVSLYSLMVNSLPALVKALHKCNSNIIWVNNHQGLLAKANLRNNNNSSNILDLLAITCRHNNILHLAKDLN